MVLLYRHTGKLSREQLPRSAENSTCKTNTGMVQWTQQIIHKRKERGNMQAQNRAIRPLTVADLEAYLDIYLISYPAY